MTAVFGLMIGFGLLSAIAESTIALFFRYSFSSGVIAQPIRKIGIKKSRNLILTMVLIAI
jgi:hypothetical protein